ncbi:unnamed protein product [Miscanthus lutarioriparius]|uniref:Defensin-like protein n=1 Tax=Miscanthus lutarioriparius TaxID=422564 RepID=A0A811PJR5_9POAL|nr:unnamed protein product [Miscanthus lutarioriparius]
MRTSHGALLAVAMVVMAMLSTGICTEFPPEYACSKILYSSGCDDRCPDECFSQLKGDGLCIGEACQCSYLCRPPPSDI